MLLFFDDCVASILSESGSVECFIEKSKESINTFSDLKHIMPPVFTT